MGRSLRSGKTIKSLSPPTRRVRDPPPKKKAAAAAAASTSSAKGGEKKAGAPTAATTRQRHPMKEEEESDDDDGEDDEVMAATKSSQDDSGSGSTSSDSGSDSGEDDSESDDEAPAPKPASGKKTASAKEDSSESESSDGEDDVMKVAPKPLQKSKVAHMEEDGGSSSEEGSDDDSDDDDDDDDSDDDKGAGFTDDNSNWLKPKQQKQQQSSNKAKLLSSDEEDVDDDEFDAVPSGDEEDDEDMLEVERQSRLIDAEMEAERTEAEAEMRRTIAQQTSVFHLPTPEELAEEEGNRVVPPSELRARVEDVLEVLAEFKARREPGRSRSEYLERLSSDMAELFGYLPELVEYFLSMFGPNECLEFLEASDKSRPLVVRVNTLKTRRKDLAAALMKRGVRLDPLAPWSKVGLKIYESTVPVGATPEYLSGQYMLQSAASMCPVMALSPMPGDRVLDMSAAPGGKTSYISQLMRNKGVVIANDLKPERQKATVANLHRLGVRNAVTCCYDGRKIGSQILRNSFDRILLDAPCSGLGVISRDPSVKVQRTIPDVHRCAHLQKELLVSAIDALNHKSKKGGGFMVYSTCSVAVAENEEVVNYLLSKRDVKIVDAGLDFGKPGFTRFEHKRFHPSLALTRRFYPHVHNMDGFYVAKIQKLSDERRGEEDKEKAERAAKKAALEGDDEGKSGEGENKRESSKKKQKGKNRREVSKSATEEGDEENVAARKKSKMSFAPKDTKMQKKKKITNAKMTKPRRMKVTGM